jgi:hypothetical protein
LHLIYDCNQGGAKGLQLAYRLSFRRTEDECLHVVAHPDPSKYDAEILTVDHADPTVFITALGAAGVSTEFETNLSIAAESAWMNHGIEVCCEAAELMDGQLKGIGFRPRD